MTEPVRYDPATRSFTPDCGRLLNAWVRADDGLIHYWEVPSDEVHHERGLPLTVIELTSTVVAWLHFSGRPQLVPCQLDPALLARHPLVLPERVIVLRDHAPARTALVDPSPGIRVLSGHRVGDRFHQELRGPGMGEGWVLSWPLTPDAGQRTLRQARIRTEDPAKTAWLLHFEGTASPEADRLLVRGLDRQCRTLGHGTLEPLDEGESAVLVTTGPDAALLAFEGMGADRRLERLAVELPGLPPPAPRVPKGLLACDIDGAFGMVRGFMEDGAHRQVVAPDLSRDVVMPLFGRRSPRLMDAGRGDATGVFDTGLRTGCAHLREEFVARCFPWGPGERLRSYEEAAVVWCLAQALSGLPPTRAGWTVRLGGTTGLVAEAASLDRIRDALKARHYDLGDVEAPSAQRGGTPAALAAHLPLGQAPTLGLLLELRWSACHATLVRIPRGTVPVDDGCEVLGASVLADGLRSLTRDRTRMTSRVPLGALRLEGDVRDYIDRLSEQARSWFAARLAEHPELEPQLETTRRLWLDGYGWQALLPSVQEEELCARMARAFDGQGLDDHVRLRDPALGSFRLLGVERARPAERFIQHLKARTANT
ncbi:MAG: hypothetical protein RL199_170 [Pseudomonadota bacterium]|jgi:hypothetical protein